MWKFIGVWYLNFSISNISPLRLNNNLGDIVNLGNVSLLGNEEMRKEAFYKYISLKMDNGNCSHLKWEIPQSLG